MKISILLLLAFSFFCQSDLYAKGRTRRVFGLLNAASFSTLQPYGYARTDIPFNDESFEQNVDGTLTAASWNDYWFEWATQRLLFPSTNTEDRIDTIQVLGSLRVPETFHFILDALKDRFGLVEIRKAAVESLKRWGGFVAARILSDQLKLEKDPEIKLALNDALIEMGGRPNEKNLSVTSSPDGSSRLEWQ